MHNVHLYAMMGHSGDWWPTDTESGSTTRPHNRMWFAYQVQYVLCVGLTWGPSACNELQRLVPLFQIACIPRKRASVILYCKFAIVRSMMIFYIWRIFIIQSKWLMLVSVLDITVNAVFFVIVVVCLCVQTEAMCARATATSQEPTAFAYKWAFALLWSTAMIVVAFRANDGRVRTPATDDR